MKTNFLILLFTFTVLLVACQQSVTSSSGQEETLVPTTTESTPLPDKTPQATSAEQTLPPLSPNVFENLDQDEEWEVYPEGSPEWFVGSASTPSLDGNVLRCAITGGSPYSNVHCYRNLPPAPTANTFTLTLSFWFSPKTTCANQGETSIVQALEFTMNKCKVIVQDVAFFSGITEIKIFREGFYTESDNIWIEVEP